MRKFLASTVIIFSLFGTAQAQAQDFQNGLAAYKAGDYATALREWWPLAEQGHPKAQYNLAEMHRKGQGVLQDYKEAVKWYRRAAKQEYTKAQVNLGFMYDFGEGVLQDTVLAHM